MLLKNYYNYTTQVYNGLVTATTKLFSVDDVMSLSGKTCITASVGATNKGYPANNSGWCSSGSPYTPKDTVIASGSLTAPSLDDYTIDDDLSDSVTCTTQSQVASIRTGDVTYSMIWTVKLTNNSESSITVNKIYIKRTVFSNTAVTLGTTDDYMFIWMEMLLDNPVTLDAGNSDIIAFSIGYKIA